MHGKYAIFFKYLRFYIDRFPSIDFVIICYLFNIELKIEKVLLASNNSQKHTEFIIRILSITKYDQNSSWIKNSRFKFQYKMQHRYTWEIIATMCVILSKITQLTRHPTDNYSSFHLYVIVAIARGHKP